MAKIRDEIGGDFDWQWPRETGTRLSWPQGSVFYSTGRSFLAAVCRTVAGATRRSRLWIPSYFCQEVVEHLRFAACSLAFYEDYPDWPAPDFDSLKSQPGDLVLAVNYFGVRQAAPWNTWRSVAPGVVLIEDHTHDPWSLWARSSEADYAFASLRKTLPIPDGALVWSPRGLVIPEPAEGTHRGSAIRLAGMMRKRIYLQSTGNGTRLKESFRSMQRNGELLLCNQDAPHMSEWAETLLASGAPSHFRARRENNVQALLRLVPRSDLAEPLFDSWPEGHCPFNPVLLFRQPSDRESARTLLINADIYAPVHWPIPHAQSGRALDLSLRLLTIPVDYRCEESQLERVASVFNALGSPITK